MISQVVVQGTLQADGTLELDRKPELPPGRVQVIVEALPVLPAGDPFWQMMEQIWTTQCAAGYVPRSAQQVEAERRAVREEWETRMHEIERLQNEARAARQATETP